MKKRLAALFAPLLLILGLSTAVTPPASAAQTGYECVWFHSINTCAQVSFIKQTDGSGVHVSMLAARVDYNCGHVSRLGPNSWHITNGQTGLDLSEERNWYGDCSTNKWIQRNGQDEGNIVFTTWLYVDRNWWNGGDHAVYFQWRLYPSGNSVLLSKGWH